MFDDRLFDVIMEEMMAEVGNDMRTDEGSLIYNACAKIASKLEEVYGDMEEINDNMLPDTQDIEHLIRYAKERGISYKYATAPIVKGVFAQEIEIGERFSCGDYNYTVTELIENFDYKLECETEGTEANGNTGQLEMIDYVDDYLGGEITEVITPGEDDEDEEVFRARVLESFQSTAFGGNKADYRLFVDAITGVGGCKPVRRDADSEYVCIWLINSEYLTPSNELVSVVQSLVDPEQNHGEGDGMAPICHKVLIKGVNTENIAVSTSITWDTGYSAGTSMSQVEQAIEEYFYLLRKNWESNEQNDTIVRIAQIEAQILAIEGVLDMQGTTLNGTTENIVLDYTSIPALGGVTIV